VCRPPVQTHSDEPPKKPLTPPPKLPTPQELASDRARRAAQAGLPLESVPAVEGLTVRVINNVMKKCEVRGQGGKSGFGGVALVKGGRPASNVMEKREVSGQGGESGFGGGLPWLKGGKGPATSCRSAR
jgi:hypothetical protein